MAASPSVTVLGTGTMGVGMTHSLLREGLPVTVWNRHIEKARPLADDGATVVESLADAVAASDLVITMLFDVDSVEAVVAEAAGSFREGAVWLQMSTVGREGIARLAALAEQHGLTMVDAPVVGTKQPAETGKLTILAAGPAAAHELAQPAFDAMGAKTVWLGDEAGPASAMKLAANAWVAALTAGTALAVEQMKGFGLDPKAFLDAMDGGAANSPYLQAKGTAMIEGAFDPQFGLNGLLKDLKLIRTATADAGISTTTVDALVTLYQRASDAGHGGEDVAAVITALAPDAR